MPQSPQSPRSQQSQQSTYAPEVDRTDQTTEDAADAVAHERAADDDELAEFRQWKTAQARAQVRAQTTAHPTVKVKEPDPFEPDDLVTLLMPNVLRGVIEGVETKEGRVYFSKTRRDFIGTEQPGQIDEDTGKAGRSLALTLTFVGGVCKGVPYAVAKGLKKSRAFRSNDALKFIPNDTPEATYAKLCGVQPMQPNKMAALLLASDLDAVLAGFDTEQLKIFTEALKRRAQQPQQPAPQEAGILSTQSFQRG